MQTIITLLTLSLTATATFGQTRTGAEVYFEGPSGPVTVVSVQPPLPNADHYRIGIAALDSDGDGFIQRGEVPESHALASEFKLVDLDRDGKASRRAGKLEVELRRSGSAVWHVRASAAVAAAGADLCWQPAADEHQFEDA